MRQRGLGNPQARGGAARKDTVDAITKKFAHMQTTLNREGTMDALKIADSGARDNVQKLLGRKIKDLTDLLKKTSDATEKENIKSQLTAWHHWKTQFEADALKTPNADATKDFFAWLLGKGKEEHHRNTPWYREPQMLHLKDVQEWIDGFADIFAESKAELIKLAWKTPQNLDEAWLYFKFIVNSDWMKREDRFFWVDLVNLQEEKAKLGGGLTKEEIDESRPYMETTEDGKKGFVPLTQEDVFSADAQEDGMLLVKNMPATLTKDQLNKEGVLIDLKRQLQRMAGMHDPRERARFPIKLRAAKNTELARIQADFALGEEEARKVGLTAAQQAQDEILRLRKGGESTYQKLASGFNKMWGGEPANPNEVPRIPEKHAAEVAKIEKSLSKLVAETTGPSWWERTSALLATGGLGADEDPLPKAPELRERVNEIKEARDGLHRLSELAEFDPEARQKFTQMFAQLNSMYNAAVRMESGVEAIARGIRGTEIPGYVAAMGILKTPDMFKMRIQVDEAVSKAVRDSASLAGKTMATQDLGKLQKSARVAKVLQTFLESREALYQTQKPRVGAEVQYVNAALQERWTAWLTQAGIEGELREQLASAPDDPIKLQGYYRSILDLAGGNAEFLVPYVLSTAGSHLQEVFANVVDQAKTDEFGARLTKYQMNLSEEAQRMLDPFDRVQVLAFQKTWKNLLRGVGTDFMLRSMREYFSAVGGGVVQFVVRAGKSVAINLVGNRILSWTLAATGMPGAGFGASFAFTILAKYMMGMVSMRDFTSRGWLMGQLMSGMLQFMSMGVDKQGVFTGYNFQNGSWELFVSAFSYMRETSLITNPAATTSFQQWSSYLMKHLPQWRFLTGLGLSALMAAGPISLLGALGIKTAAMGYATVAGSMFATYNIMSNTEKAVPFLSSLLSGAMFNFEPTMLDQLRTAYFATSAASGGPKETAMVQGDARAAWSNVLWQGEWPERQQRPADEAYGDTQTFPSKAIVAEGLYNMNKEGAPFIVRLLAATVANDFITSAGQFLASARMTGALGLGPLDLLRGDLSQETKAHIAVYQLYQNATPIINEFKTIKLDVIRNIDEMRKINPQEIYFDYLNVSAQVALRKRYQDLSARRRLLPLRPKKKFLQSTESKFDKRTGEGLVKLVGGKRVQVQ